MDPKEALLQGIISKGHEMRGGTKVWRLAEFKLLFLTEGQVDSYLTFDDSEDYKEGMHDAETNLIKQNVEKFLSYLGDDVRFVDLGCGEGKKSIEIIEAAKAQGKEVVFYPVDISEKFLDIAVENAKKAEIETYPLQKDFMKPHEIFTELKEGGQKFIYLGANFSNFDSDLILGTISEALEEGDVMYFSLQINKGDTAKIVSEYDNDIMNDYCRKTMAPLGFQPENMGCHARYNDETGRIEVYFEIKSLPEGLEDSPLEVGDEVIIYTSFKPTLEKFTEIARKYFEGEVVSNEEGSYAGFLGRSKS